MRRQLEFMAQYDLDCQIFDSKMNRDMVLYLAQHRYDQIENLCGGRKLQNSMQ